MDIRYILGFLFCGVVIVSEAAYSDTVSSYFDDMDGAGWKFNKSFCTTTARAKMSNFGSKSADEQYAIGMINIYTQECMSGTLTFYRELNRQLRSKRPGEFWNTADGLINKAIDILSGSTYDKLYQGCWYIDKTSYSKGDIFHFNQFVNTSRNPETALSVAGCDSFYILSDVPGADVSPYSMYSGEAEVLLKSSLDLKLEQDPVTDPSEVRKLKNKLGLFSSSFTKVIHLTLDDVDISGGTINLVAIEVIVMNLIVFLLL